MASWEILAPRVSRETSVEEIVCGYYHVAVLTCKSQVYTWGKGLNGQLGHGTVAVVGFLKEKQVKATWLITFSMCWLPQSILWHQIWMFYQPEKS